MRVNHARFRRARRTALGCGLAFLWWVACANAVPLSTNRLSARTASPATRLRLSMTFLQWCRFVHPRLRSPTGSRSHPPAPSMAGLMDLLIQAANPYRKKARPAWAGRTTPPGPGGCGLSQPPPRGAVPGRRRGSRPRAAPGASVTRARGPPGPASHPALATGARAGRRTVSGAPRNRRPRADGAARSRRWPLRRRPEPAPAPCPCRAPPPLKARRPRKRLLPGPSVTVSLVSQPVLSFLSWGTRAEAVRS